jgi:hypothetical protein
MSLNRTEQQLLEYVQRNPEERHYWQQKVRAADSAHADRHEASLLLDAELRRYLDERAQVVAEFREYAGPAGKRLSLRNLAEYWLRMWGTPKPKKRTEDSWLHE